jgi:hypothetical protein
MNAWMDLELRGQNNNIKVTCQNSPKDQLLYMNPEIKPPTSSLLLQALQKYKMITDQSDLYPEGESKRAVPLVVLPPSIYILVLPHPGTVSWTPRKFLCARRKEREPQDCRFATKRIFSLSSMGWGSGDSGEPGI